MQLQDASEVPGSLSWLLNSADGLWLEETQLALSGHRIVKLVDMPPSSTIMQGHDAKSGESPQSGSALTHSPARL